MLVDIFMPHMRRSKSIRIFHERAPTVPLVAMSGYAFANLNSPAPDFLRMALELGAARCLRKPFTPGALLAVVNECLAEARSRFRCRPVGLAASWSSVIAMRVGNLFDAIECSIERRAVISASRD